MRQHVSIGTNRRFCENGSFCFSAATDTYTCLCGLCEPVGLTDLLWDLSVPTSPAGGSRPASCPVSVLNFSFLLRRRLYLTHGRFHSENHRGCSHHPGPRAPVRAVHDETWGRGGGRSCRTEGSAGRAGLLARDAPHGGCGAAAPTMRPHAGPVPGWPRALLSYPFHWLR